MKIVQYCRGLMQCGLSVAVLNMDDAGDIAPERTPEDDRTRSRYFEQVEVAVARILGTPAADGDAPFLLSIGGDHSVNIPLLSAFGKHYPQGYGLISLDGPGEAAAAP